MGKVKSWHCTVLPLPDSFDLSYSNVEADSSGETEAGTVQRDIVRSGVVSIDVAYSISKKYLPVLSSYTENGWIVGAAAKAGTARAQAIARVMQPVRIFLLRVFIT